MGLTISRLRQTSTVDLHPSHVRALISVLSLVDKYPALYLNRDVIRNAIRRYEHIWIPVLASVSEPSRIILVPPIDVEWVWLVHMLCPHKYVIDSAEMWAAVSPKETSYIVDHTMLACADRDEGTKIARRHWEARFPQEPFDITSSLQDAPLHESLKDNAEMHRPSRISYDIAAAVERQMAFHYQVGILPHYQDDDYLRSAIERYTYNFLTLQKKKPNQIWVPTFDIDLVWHTHILHPQKYVRDTTKITGRLLSHDDTLNDRTEGSNMMKRWEETRKTWYQMFGKSVEVPGGMWRGNVASEELLVRSMVRNSAGQFVREFQKTERFSVSVCSTNQTMRDQDGIVLDQIPWVHTTDYRNAIESIENNTSLGTNAAVHESFGSLQMDDSLEVAQTRFVYASLMKSEKVQMLVPFVELYTAKSFSSSARYPFASAHIAKVGSICKGGSKHESVCVMAPGELVFVLRIGGEDFGLLGGSWEGFVNPREENASARRKQYRRSLVQEPGSLSLRLWLLGPQTPDKWLSLKNSKGPGVLGHYEVEIPVSSERDEVKSRQAEHGAIRIGIPESKVEFDHAEHGAAACLIAATASMLHVILQPRMKPGVNDGHKSMYPSWGASQKDSTMLRVAGGEDLNCAEDGKRVGFVETVMRLPMNDRLCRDMFLLGSMPGGKSDGPSEKKQKGHDLQS